MSGISQLMAAASGARGNAHNDRGEAASKDARARLCTAFLSSLVRICAVYNFSLEMRRRENAMIYLLT